MIARRQRHRIRWIAAAWLPMVFGWSSIAVSANLDRTAFIETNRCDIVERLYSIHLRGPRSTSQDRFLAVSPYGKSKYYVQCIFFDDDTKMLCEAVSGRYGSIEEWPGLLSPAAEAALQALGFRLDDPNGNFAREIDIGTRPDLDRVADLMLGALHDAYGIGLEDRLKFDAPMALVSRNACPGPVW